MNSAIVTMTNTTFGPLFWTYSCDKRYPNRRNLWSEFILVRCSSFLNQPPSSKDWSY